MVKKKTVKKAKTSKAKTAKSPKKAKTSKAKTAKSPKKAKNQKEESFDDMGIVIVEDDLSIDKEKVNEERKAYLEEARSQEAFD